MSGHKVCYQINLQHHFGGGEVYTQFFSKALVELSWEVVLFVDHRAEFWHTLSMPGVKLIFVDGGDEITSHLPPNKSLVISHAPARGRLLDALQNHTYCCFAHMPFFQRSVEAFRPCHTVLGVSQYVIDSAITQELDNCYPEPLYGVADPERMQAQPTPIKLNPIYDWDERKVRDHLLSYLYPIYWRLKSKPIFQKRPGLTLGIVSRITPIKQLPLLFHYLADAIKKHPEVNLEIFGSGGYASVRDLKRALAPIKSQTRFWGHQSNIGAIYPQLDFLLTGLPEKEALGLNVIEAQMAEIPVLAPSHPPFTETVIDGETGYLYLDPRKDDGHHFEQLLTKLANKQAWPRPEIASTHIENFSYPAFVHRCQHALARIIPDKP